MNTNLVNSLKTSLLGRMLKVFVPAVSVFYLCIGVFVYFSFVNQYKDTLLEFWVEKIEDVFIQLPNEVNQIDTHIDIALEREHYLSFSNLNRDKQRTFRSLYQHLNRLHQSERVKPYSDITLLLIDSLGNVIERNQHIRASLLSVLLAEAKVNLTSDIQRFHKVAVVDNQLLVVTAVRTPQQYILLSVHPATVFGDLIGELNDSFGEHYNYRVQVTSDTELETDGMVTVPSSLFGAFIPHPHPEWFTEPSYSEAVEHTYLGEESSLALSVRDPVVEFSMSIDQAFIADELWALKLKVAFGVIIATLVTMLLFHLVISRYVVNPLEHYTRQVTRSRANESAEDIEIEQLRDAYTAVRLEMRTTLEVDELTGIGSRKLFFKELKRLVIDQEGTIPGYLVYLDIDNFKWVNEHHGHDYADRFLVDFADKTRGLIVGYIESSSSVTFCRLAVDQFGVYIQQTQGFSQALQLIHAIQDLFHPHYRFEGNELPISVSIGVVEVDHYSQTLGLESLQSYGERALQAAKAQDGNHYQFYNVDIDHQVRKGETMERELINSLIHDSFKLVFMPIVTAKGKHVRGYEILTRCPSLEKMNFCADEYITQAEKLGLIEEIDLWVLRNSFNLISKLAKNTSRSLIFSINISALELSNSRFPSQVATLLEQYHIDPSCIELEVTETAFVPNDKIGLEVLNALKDLGFRLVLDDFGAGYTSFHQLVHYPFDVLKIDKSFVEILNEESTNERSMVEVIYSLAKTHNLELVAEGVETQFQADYLTELGCEWLQGYYFSKPISEDLMRFEVLQRPHLELVVKGAF